MGRRNTATLSKQQLREIFINHSKEKTSVKLGKGELKTVFQYLGAQLPSYQAECALQYLNTNQDQYITDDELSGLVDYAYAYGFRG